MNTKDFNNLNGTPVRTKNWLNINDISIKNIEVEENKKFNNINIKNESNGIIIKKLNNKEEIEINKEFVYGISKELINQGEERFNLGYLINIEKNTNAKEPVVIEFNMDNENNLLIDNLTINCEENSKAKIIIRYKSLDNSVGYHNGICKIFSRKNSDVQVIKVNLLNNNTVNFDSNFSDIENEGNVEFIAVDLGGKYSITNYHGDLIGEKSSSSLKSLYLGYDKKIIDINYVMTHRGKESRSNIVTKGALQDESKKTFRGTIDFKRGASLSSGAESEYCMMLSKKARSKAMPLLLCEEDNVSGEHSASSGKIDENKLFYLMSRGLSYEESKILIVQAAFNPVINAISQENIKEEVLNEVNRRLINE